MLLSDNYSGDKIKEGELGRAYGTHEGEEKFMQSYGGKRTLWET